MSHTNIPQHLLRSRNCKHSIDLLLLTIGSLSVDVVTRTLPVRLDSQLLHMSLEQNGPVTENCNHCSLIGFELCRFSSLFTGEAPSLLISLAMSGSEWAEFQCRGCLSPPLNECVEFNWSLANRTHTQWPSPVVAFKKTGGLQFTSSLEKLVFSWALLT